VPPFASERPGYKFLMLHKDRGISDGEGTAAYVTPEAQYPSAVAAASSVIDFLRPSSPPSQARGFAGTHLR